MTKYSINNRLKLTKKNQLKECQYIKKAINKMSKMLETYDNNGIPFEKIFNNDIIKHNCLDNDIYVFKYIGPDNSQIRLLYHYDRKDDLNSEINILTYHIKRTDAPNSQYLDDFRAYAKNYK